MQRRSDKGEGNSANGSSLLCVSTICPSAAPVFSTSPREVRVMRDRCTWGRVHAPRAWVLPLIPPQDLLRTRSVGRLRGTHACQSPYPVHPARTSAGEQETQRHSALPLCIRWHHVARKAVYGGALPLCQPVLDTPAQDEPACTVTFGRSLHRLSPVLTVVVPASDAEIPSVPVRA
jgi:hypothetical protein